MSAYAPINIEDINVDEITIQLPKKDSGNGNGKAYHIHHKNVKLRVILPELECPFGAGPGRTDQTAKKYSLGVSFNGMHEDTKRGRRIAVAHEKMTAIENKITELLLGMKETVWSKDHKKKDNNALKERVKPFILRKDDEGKPDMFYMNLKTKEISRLDPKESAKMTDEEKETYEQQFVTMKPNAPLLVDKDNKPIDVDTVNIKEVVPWGTKIKVVTELAYLWAMGENAVYPVWILSQGMITNFGASQEFQIRKDSDDESDDRMDDDDEEEEEDEEEAMADA